MDHRQIFASYLQHIAAYNEKKKELDHLAKQIKTLQENIKEFMGERKLREVVCGDKSIRLEYSKTDKPASKAVKEAKLINLTKGNMDQVARIMACIEAREDVEKWVVCVRDVQPFGQIASLDSIK